MRITLLFISLIVSFIAHADEPPSLWFDSCSLENTKFQINFRSQSGDATNDDMVVTITTDRKNSQLRLPLEPAWFEKPLVAMNMGSICESLVAVGIGQKKIAIFIPWNARPSWNRLDVAVIDINSMKVIAIKHNVGAIKTHEIVIRKINSTVYDVRLIREELPNTGCDCADKYIDDWMRLTFLKSKIEFTWEHP